MDFLANKQLLIVIGVIIALIIIIFFIGKVAGKKAGPQNVSLPTDIQAQGTVIANWNPGPFTDNIKTETDKSWFSLWNPVSTAPFCDADALSNTQLAAIYNDWNQRYYPSVNKTIVQAIQNMSTANFEAWGCASSIVSRITSIIGGAAS